MRCTRQTEPQRPAAPPPAARHGKPIEIEPIEGGCALFEQWTGARGPTGKSLNIYDALRRIWHQTWVDDRGMLLTLEGRWDGKSMILEGLAPAANGVMVGQRITWTANADGSVRQLWESADGKGGWTVAFDGRYTKK